MVPLLSVIFLFYFLTSATDCNQGKIKTESDYLNFLRFGENLLKLKKFDAAGECFVAASEKYPKRFEAWHYLTVLYVYEPTMRPHTQRGLEYFQKYIETKPLTIEDKRILNDFSTVARGLEDHERAALGYRKILDLEPNDTLTRAFLAYTYNSLSQFEKSFVEMKKFVTLLFELDYNRISSEELALYRSYFRDALVVFNTMSKASLISNSEFKSICEQGIEYFAKEKGMQAHVYGVLGTLMNSNGSPREAIEYLKKGAEIDRDEILFPFEMGKAYSLIGATESASEQFERAVELPAKSGQKKELIYYSLAMTTRFSGDHVKAFRYAKSAYEMDRTNTLFLSEYLHLLLSLCKWQEFNELLPPVQNALALKDINFLVSFQATGVYLGFSSKIMYQLASRDAQRYNQPEDKLFQHFHLYNRVKEPTEKVARAHISAPRTIGKRKLKIAYISSNFRNHAQGTQMSSYFKEHDRERFEVYAFSLVRAETPEARDRQKILKPQFDHWVDVETLTDYKLAQKINEYGIDIAIDLCGLADLPQLSAYSYRPAPVQISFLGYPGTTGANFIDYYVADEISVPPTMYDSFSEKLIILPNSYQVTEHKQDYQLDPKVEEYLTHMGPLAELISSSRDGTIIFANFNQPIKISQQMFHVWMSLLKRVENSELWLSAGKSKENLNAEARKLGVNPNRIKYLGSIPKEIHVYRLRLATMLLDTDTYNAHTSAGDALWAGIPIVTIIGETMPARVCASMIAAYNLTKELVTHSLKEYEEVAYELATNTKKLKELKERIEENRNRVTLFDTKLFVQNFEIALDHAWDLFINRSSPQTFLVQDLPQYLDNQNLESYQEDL